MPERDWLAPLDDHLCQRLTHCTLCGTGRGTVAYLGVWDLATTPRRSLAYVVCGRCYGQPTWETALRARLQQRYTPRGAGDA